MCDGWVMRATASMCAGVVWVLGAVAGCNGQVCLDSAYCAQAQSPFTDVDISQGMAGLVTSTSDAVDRFGCGECGPGWADLFVFAASAPVTASTVTDVVVGGEARVLIVKERFAERFRVGDFVVCGSLFSSARCSPAAVMTSRVTTVHMISGFGGSEPRVMNGQGQREPVFDVDIDLYAVRDAESADEAGVGP